MKTFLAGVGLVAIAGAMAFVAAPLCAVLVALWIEGRFVVMKRKFLSWLDRFGPVVLGLGFVGGFLAVCWRNEHRGAMPRAVERTQEEVRAYAAGGNGSLHPTFPDGPRGATNPTWGGNPTNSPICK
jgi:hypothetical protein